MIPLRVEESAAERLVLRALPASGVGRTSGELADETGLLPLAVRACLRDLRGRGLVCRTAAARWRLNQGEQRRP